LVVGRVTLIRSAIRGLLGAADPVLEQRLRAALSSGDQYVAGGKPVIDWDDKAARTALVDAQARDGYALLQVLEGHKDLPEPVDQAARLLVSRHWPRCWVRTSNPTPTTPMGGASHGASRRTGSSRPSIPRLGTGI
jgi:hypothetical protein